MAECIKIGRDGEVADGLPLRALFSPEGAGVVVGWHTSGRDSEQPGGECTWEITVPVTGGRWVLRRYRIDDAGGETSTALQDVDLVEHGWPERLRGMEGAACVACEERVCECDTLGFWMVLPPGVVEWVEFERV